MKMEVFVIGEVKKPGLINIKSNSPLSKAVLAAGGPTNVRAKRSNIMLLRVNKDGSVLKKRYKLDLSKGISNKKNPPLRNGDSIIVARNNFSKLSDLTLAIGDPAIRLNAILKLFGED